MSWPRPPGAALIHVPRVADDVEVQRFIEAEFLNFLSCSPKLTAVQMLDAACKMFGRSRCGTISFWEH